MKVFVTGGTGFVGREILWQLNEAGHDIRLLSRRGTRDEIRQLAYRYRAEIVEGSLADPGPVDRSFTGCDAVIHLVGIIAETRGNTFQSVHVDGTRSILQQADAAGVRRFIHMSALGTRAGARSRYHQTKWQAEELVRKSGLDWTIFRPSVIYGREDGFVNLLAKLCRRSPVIPVFGAGHNQLQPVPVEDVARAFVGALREPLSVGQSYDLGGMEVFTMEALYDVILRATDRWRPKVHLPMALARMQAGFLEALCSMIGKTSPLTRDQLLMLEENNVGNPQPAASLFKLVLPPFADGISKYLR